MDTSTLTPLVANLPESVQANVNLLLEEMATVIEGVGDQPITWRPQFLRLVQGTTDRSSMPKGTAPGDFILGESKLEQPFKFIVLSLYDTRTYWDPDQTSNKILCSSPDAKLGAYGVECRGCPHSQWNDAENKPSPCSKNKQALCISADGRHVFTITFAKSNYKVGMELESLLKAARVNPYMRVYQVESTTDQKSKNVEIFKVSAPAAAERNTPPEFLPFLKALFEKVRADRQEGIAMFYDNAKKRREQAALGNSSAPAGLLETTASPSNDAAATPPVEGAVSSMAAKYEV